MRISKNGKEILSKILKSKSQKKLSLDEYIDKICTEFGKINNEKINDEVQNLYLFVLENFGISKDELLNLINSKIEKISLETAVNSEEIYLKIKGENAKISPVLNSSFDSVDFKAIKLIDDSFYWLGNEYNERLQTTLKDTIKEFMSGEIDRKNIAQSLADKLKGVVKENASISYFEGVADNIINQNRNLNMVINADEDVEFFKVMARMDNKTSAICRSMHGRLIPAKHLQKQAKNLLNAKSMSDKKNASAWSSEAYLGRSDKMAHNFGLPPYHFHCRTMIVPVYTKKGENGEFYTGVKSDDEVLRHIDKMGVERYADEDTYKHSLSSRARKITPQDTIKALNSITKIAPHSKFSDRYVAISQNGYFMVFKGDYLYNIFKPERNLDKYFKDSAIKEKTEIIKWKFIR